MEESAQRKRSVPRLQRVGAQALLILCWCAHSSRGVLTGMPPAHQQQLLSSAGAGAGLRLRGGGIGFLDWLLVPSMDLEVCTQKNAA
jgi:hypothetical protein